MRSLAATLLPLLLAGCGERATLLIELQHPAGLDPAALQGSLQVSLLRAGDGGLVQQKSVDSAGLGSRGRLFEGLDLESGTEYRLRLELTLDAGESSCSSSGGRAVGVSPPFRYDSALERLSVYLDCADRASDTGKPLQGRIYHSATLLPGPGPHGQVLLVGGAEPSTSIEDPDSAVLLDTIERYDPATGRFELLPGRLGRPRMLHRSVAVDGDLIVSGGMDRVTVVSETQLVSLKSVERVRDGRVAALPEMRRARSMHGVAHLGGKLVLSSGMGATLLDLVQEAEVYDPTGQEGARVVPLKWPRFTMASVPLGDDRRVLLAGGLRVDGVDVPHELLCLSGSCACGPAPCAMELPAGYGAGKGRYGVTGTLVACPDAPGTGAVYLVGGSYKDEQSQVEEYHDDIHCLDAASPGAQQHVGRLVRPRGGHTTTLVRGPGGVSRLLVAGGSGTKSSGEVTIWDTAELIDVGCSCKPLAASREVKLQSARALHTATLLADGTVLLAGGIFVGVGAERFNPDL